MTFPSGIEDLRILALEMRKLNILQAFGVILGPPLSAIDILQESLAISTDENKKEELKEELREEIFKAKIEAERENVRNLLAASRHTYSDEELDRFIDIEAIR